MTEMLAALAFIALTVPGFIRAVRTLPWVADKVAKAEKPWVCDVCMTFWSVLLWGAVPVGVWGFSALVALPPAYTLALWLLGRLEEPTTPFQVPDGEEA